MEAVSDTISMINGKTPIGRTPTVGEVIKGFQFIGGDPNDRNRWVKQGSQPPEDVRQRYNERQRLQQQAITDGPRATGEELLRQADAAVADAQQIINKPAPGNPLPANAASAPVPIASPQSARMEELRQLIASGKGSDEDKLNAQMEFIAMKSANTPAQKNGTVNIGAIQVPEGVDTRIYSGVVADAKRMLTGSTPWIDGWTLSDYDKVISSAGKIGLSGVALEKIKSLRAARLAEASKSYE